MEEEILNKNCYDSTSNLINNSIQDYNIDNLLVKAKEASDEINEIEILATMKNLDETVSITQKMMHSLENTVYPGLNTICIKSKESSFGDMLKVGWKKFCDFIKKILETILRGLKYIVSLFFKIKDYIIKKQKQDKQLLDFYIKAKASCKDIGEELVTSYYKDDINSVVLFDNKNYSKFEIFLKNCRYYIRESYDNKYIDRYKTRLNILSNYSAYSSDFCNELLNTLLNNKTEEEKQFSIISNLNYYTQTSDDFIKKFINSLDESDLNVWEIGCYLLDYSYQLISPMHSNPYKDKATTHTIKYADQKVKLQTLYDFYTLESERKTFRTLYSMKNFDSIKKEIENTIDYGTGIFGADSTNKATFIGDKKTYSSSSFFSTLNIRNLFDIIIDYTSAVDKSASELHSINDTLTPLYNKMEKINKTLDEFRKNLNKISNGVENSNSSNYKFAVSISCYMLTDLFTCLVGANNLIQADLLSKEKLYLSTNSFLNKLVLDILKNRKNKE